MAPPKAPVRRYYTPYEVAKHSSPDDCWVSFLGGVYDLTGLLKHNPGRLIEPLIKVAGQDISKWFDIKTRDLRTHVCPVTNLQRFYTPMDAFRILAWMDSFIEGAMEIPSDPTRMGRFLHVPTIEPMGNWDTSYGIPWWKDKTLFVGHLSSKVRVVRVKNVLTTQEDTIEVPSEETIVEIRERYLEINWHAKSYTWKALLPKEDGTNEFQELDMNKTLAENGLSDEAKDFEDHHVPNDFYVPILHVYWNDDLTVA